MSDRDRVIKELENYEPYARVFSNITVSGHVVIDALELLKEQESNSVKGNDEVLQVNSWEDEWYGAVALCPKCGCQWMMGNDEDLYFCPKCGRAVKWIG